MDLFRTPGSNLMGIEKSQFDEMKSIIDRATNELLLRPDWEANLQCIDQFNVINSPDVIYEVMFLFRKKFNAKQPKVIYLSLCLIEALVKNCGHKAYAAVNSDVFLKELGKVARRFVNKPGEDNREVSVTCLDMIQAWGEAFLPLQNKYPNLSKLYQELRKEKLPFRPQYDESKAPVFTSDEVSTISGSRPSISNSRRSIENNDDPMLQAALAASLRETKISNQSRSSITENSSKLPLKLSKKSSTIVDSVTSSSNILKEIIIAASNINEINSNEIIPDVLSQISQSQSKLTQHIERASIEFPEDIDALFKINDDVQNIIACYENLKKGIYTLEKAKSVLLDNSGSSNKFPSTDTSNYSNSNTSYGSNENTAKNTTNSLLDFGSSFLTSKSARTSITSNNTNTNANPSKPTNQSEMFEETMGLFTMTNTASPIDRQIKRASSTQIQSPPNSQSNQTRVNNSQIPSAPTIQSNQTKAISSQEVDLFAIPSNTSNNQTNKDIFDDPFGPSSSSIDALLLEGNNSKAIVTNTNTVPVPKQSSNILDLFNTNTSINNSNNSMSGMQNQPINYPSNNASFGIKSQPLTYPSNNTLLGTQNPSFSPPSQPVQVDPLDSLMSIASRSNDDFGFSQQEVSHHQPIYQNPPPPVPNIAYSNAPIVQQPIHLNSPPPIPTNIAYSNAPIVQNSYPGIDPFSQSSGYSNPNINTSQQQSFINPPYALTQNIPANNFPATGPPPNAWTQVSVNNALPNNNIGTGSALLPPQHQNNQEAKQNPFDLYF